MADAGKITIYPSALARDAALDARAAVQGGAAWAEDDLTFQQWLQRLDRALPRSGDTIPQELSEPARLALLREVWLACAARDGTLPASWREPARGALEALARLVAAWKGAGLRPDDARRAADALEPPAVHLAATLRPLAAIWSAYEDALGAAWTDREGWQQEVLARLRAASSLPNGLAGAKAEILVQDTLRLPPFHRAVWTRLIELGARVWVRPAVDANNPQPTVGALVSLLPAEGPLREAYEPAEAKPAPKKLERWVAPTPYAETYEIGRRVKAWLEAGAAQAHEIAVVFRDLGPYSQFLADVFRRLGVPYYERRGEPLRFQPLVRVALTALEAVRDGLDAESVFRFLCAGPVDAAALAGEREPLDPFALRALAQDARVGRLYGADRHRAAEVWTRKLDAYEAYRTGAGKKIDSRAVRALKSIVRKLESLGAPRTRSKFVEAWRTFWKDAGLAAGGVPNEARDAASLRNFYAALDACAEGPGARTERLKLEEFAELFESVLGGENLTLEGNDRAGGVRVLNLYDLRGLNFKKVILSGLMEAHFPTLPGADALLGGGIALPLRRAFARAAPQAGPLAGIEPRLREEAYEDERALLALAWRAAAGGELWLTRSKTDADGKPAGASVFWDEDAFREIKEEPAASVRPAPPLPRCVLPEEAELRTAWILGGGGSGTGREAERASAAALAQPPAGRLRTLVARAQIEHRRRTFFDAKAPELTHDASNAQVAAGAFDGDVGLDAPEAAGMLARRWLSEAGANQVQPMAPTAIETLARCGFRFLSERLYGARDREEPEEELSPLARGSLWHTVLQRFYEAELQAARDAGGYVAILDPARRVAYLNRLETLAREACAEAEADHFTGQPGLWKLQRTQLEAGLGVWLEHEFAELQRGGSDAYRPAFVEFAFGPKRSDARGPMHGEAVEVRIPDPGGPRTLLLEGRFDRLDLCVDDPRSRVPLVRGLRLVDYKTGRGAYLRDALQAEALEALLNAQLPVYLAAAVQFLRSEVAAQKLRVDWDALWERSTAAYYALGDLPEARRAGKSALLAPKAWPGDSLRAFVDGAEGTEALLFEAVRARVAEALSGRFAVRPLECGGTHCAARFACRYREVPGAADSPAAGEG